MKRNVESRNTVDGATLKKIKRLMFKDDEQNDDVNTNDQTVREKVAKKADLTDSDSDSDDESVHSLNHDDEEELNEEETEIIARYNNPLTARSIVKGMGEARDEVASNLDFGEMQELDCEQMEGLRENMEEIKLVLQTYRKSKIFPKFPKILPQIPDWEFIMNQLDFPSWSPAAVKIMANQFRAKGGKPAELFYKDYMLPYTRENIARNKRLDNILFQALTEALYRRKEFMRGILYPWCADNIEGKEAEVLSNVIKTATVKSDVAAPALFHLTKLEYSKGRLSIMHSFLEKKYTLPFMVIKAIVDYFHKSTGGDYSHHYTDNGQLPVSWFITLNLFVSLNYEHLDEEDRKKMSKICSVNKHPKITPAIQAYLRMK